MSQKKYEDAEPVQDEAGILKLLNPELRRHKYIVATDEVRIDIYEDGINIDSKYYKVSPEAVAGMIYNGSVEIKPLERRRPWEPPVDIPCHILSHIGLAKIEEAAARAARAA